MGQIGFNFSLHQLSWLGFQRLSPLSIVCSVTYWLVWPNLYKAGSILAESDTFSNLHVIKCLYATAKYKEFVPSGLRDKQKLSGRQRSMTQISDNACVITLQLRAYKHDHAVPNRAILHHHGVTHHAPCIHGRVVLENQRTKTVLWILTQAPALLQFAGTSLKVPIFFMASCKQL
jgi:hypothetical protein